jgi:hypothetical protein
MAIDQSVIPKTESRQPIEATMPTPGGPQGQPMSVRDALAKEMVSAGQIAQQTEQRLGVVSEKRPVRERAIKIGGKIIAQDELNESLRTQDTAINDFLQQAGYTNAHDINIAKSYMTERFNKARYELIKIANEFNKKLAKEKIDREKKMKIAGNLGAIAGAIGGAIIGSAAGPMGTMAGASIGGAAGGKVGQGVGSEL